MSEIKTNRINGYLNLNHYFFKRLGREFVDLEDLYINGLIEYEPEGISNKFWILSDEGEKIALYKQNIPNSYEAYAELLVEEIANIMDIPTAHYDLAMFNGNYGVISYSFTKGTSVDYSGFEVISEFYAMNLEDDPELSELYNIDYVNDNIDDVCDKLNNLQDIWSILENRFKDDPNKDKIVKTIMDGLVSKLMLDIIVVGIDSHCDNWKIIDDEHFAPVFDNSRSLGIYAKFRGSNVTNDRRLEDYKLLLTVDDEKINKPLEVLKYFLKISSSEYRDIFVEKINKLKTNFDSIPLKIEERTNSLMPVDLKNYFVTNMSEYLEKVSAIASVKESKK